MKRILNLFFGPVFFLSLLCVGRSLPADIVWDEGINGDLSSAPATPTELDFVTGINTVIGTLSEPDGDLRDYLTFTIGPNQFLTALTLDVFTPSGTSFHAINEGNTSFIPGSDPSNRFLGLELVDETMVGMDVLPDLALGSYGSGGFTIPLGPGTYSYLIQEVTGGQARAYQISFSVVPEPSLIGTICLVGPIVALRRRRRHQ